MTDGEHSEVHEISQRLDRLMVTVRWAVGILAAVTLAGIGYFSGTLNEHAARLASVETTLASVVQQDNRIRNLETTQARNEARNDERFVSFLGALNRIDERLNVVIDLIERNEN